MGEVFRAHDGVLDRHVALKVISADDEDRRQRFRREAQSAARLTHANIVVVHDFGEASGRFYMAMELLAGHDLKTAIATNAIPTLAAKLDVMEQICDAIAYAHSMGVVHRDLKPANIFVLSHGHVKILDFGLARVGHSDMTGTGTILGTPHYMSPEQIRGNRVDSRADIFALGSVFYELLSGQKSFQADSVHAILYKVIQHEPESLRTLAPSVPAPVVDMIRKAMAKDPALRFQSLAEMRDIIRTARGRDGADAISLVKSESRPLFRSDTIMVREVGSQVSVVKPSSGSTSAPAEPVPVTFSNEVGGDLVIAVLPAQTLLAASLAAGIPHTNECGGNARCSTCRVVVLENLGNLSPRDSAEIKLARKLGFTDDIRLACQTKARGPVRVRRLILDRDDINLSRVERNTIVGSELPLAMLYANVPDFAAFQKRALPYDAVHVLNRYYAQIGETVLANGGHIDRYDAGGMLALFGINGEDAKKKCTNAIRAALRMARRMEPLNAYLHEHFSTTFRFEAGLHYGRMTVGHIGHPDHQRLTALGDASKIAIGAASATREHDATIFATEELANVIESDVSTGAVVSERLSGFDREFTLYEISDFAKPDTHYLVQSSFEKIAAHKAEAARMFYDKLFEIAPNLRPMFSRDINVQGAMLMNMLAAAVKGLDRLDDLKPVLEDLGRRHFAYGVRVEHFAPVEECLIYIVKTFMGDDFNLDVQLAWTRIYNFIAQTMIEAGLAAMALS